MPRRQWQPANRNALIRHEPRRWRLLLPGAVLTGVGLLGLQLVAGAFLSHSTTPSDGPPGIVFMLLSWILAFCVVMLGGPSWARPGMS